MTKLSLLLLVAILSLTANAKYVTFNNCSDKVGCSAPTCKQQTLPTDSCIPNGSSGSQVLVCIPYAALYLSKVRFSDAKCQKAVSTEYLGCDRCFPINSSFANYASPRCMIDDSGVPVVNVSLCKNEQNASNCGCKDSIVAAEWIQGQCEPQDGGQHYDIFEGYTPCAQVLLVQYATPDCTGPSQDQLLPSNVCNGGTKVICHGDY
jgi:hypothetical protein